MRSYCLLGMLAALGIVSQANAGALLTVDVGYGFGGTSSSGLYVASPDTGFVVITNTGTEDFTGLLKLDGVSGLGIFGHNEVHDTSGPGFVLAVGASWTLLAGDEASNYGGYGKNQAGTDPAGPADDGFLLTIEGDFASGHLSFAGFDKDFHSGVPRLSVFGDVTLDNYILQGSDPFGRDTGDVFEESAAHAIFDLSVSAVPEPSTIAAWSALGALGLVVGRMRRKK